MDFSLERSPPVIIYCWMSFFLIYKITISLN
jgi:hypothetical protein